MTAPEGKVYRFSYDARAPRAFPLDMHFMDTPINRRMLSSKDSVDTAFAAAVLSVHDRREKSTALARGGVPYALQATRTR
jgi:hypothetical protein